MLMTPEKFEALKKIRLDSLKEYITMLSTASNSLKTGLTGEELAKEIIKGAICLQQFIEGEPVLQSGD
jgi:hypothetical protein